MYFLKVRVWNMRIRMNMLIGAMRDLAKYGPMKPKEDQGIDSVKTLRHFNCLSVFIVLYYAFKKNNY
jgi:hypothetical protein